MSRLFRKLEQKTWLDKTIAMKEGWSNGVSVCADALRNFKTSENTLSVFSIDDETLSSRIVSALVASSQNIPDSTDYVIFDRSVIEDLGITTEIIPGTTVDSEVNRLHIDLTKLTGDKVLKLAEKLQETGKLGRIRKKELAKILKQQIADGIIQESQLGDHVLASINKYAPE